MTLEIRLAGDSDGDAIWRIFHAVVSAGDTYAFPRDMSRDDALAYWMSPAARTYVAVDQGDVVGTYVLKSNQPLRGGGDHVSNAGFMVDPAVRGKGVGKAMGQHALEQARAQGFKAMQFNFVISSNTGAVALWKELGFAIVGTLPGAFRHPEKGLVDSYVMFRSLD